MSNSSPPQDNHRTPQPRGTESPSLLGRFLQAVEDLSPFSFRTRPKNPDSGIHLPESIIYEMRHGAEFNAETILTLANRRGFENTAVYFTAKLLHDFPEKQTSFVHSVLQHARDAGPKEYLPDEDFDGISDAVLEHLRDVPLDLTVHGSKLGLITRMGPYYWRSCLRSTIQEVVDDPKCTPVVCAYSMMLGLSSLGRILPDGDRALVMNDHQIYESGREQLGWIVTANGGKIELEVITRDTPLASMFPDTEFALIDDVLNTGETMREMGKIFEENPNYPPLKPENARFVNRTNFLHNQQKDISSPD